MTAIRTTLLRWYRRNQRELPWRETRDPYAIWLSEAMLQQTRVETVIPYWERFLSRFPTVRDLALAEMDDVLGAWAGLGYYRRARNLKHAAEEIVERFDGALPPDAKDLRSLPGVGRYTAGAVASIAFERPEPVVDGNVIRVFSRLFGIRDDVKRPAVVEEIWARADELVRGPDPGDWNQAVMELGATVCTPRNPHCLACPLAGHCDAHAHGDAASLPRKSAKKPPREVAGVAAYLVRNGKVLAVRRPEGGLLGGLWDLPGGELALGERPATGLRRVLRGRLGLEPAGPPRRLGEVDHVFTHRRLRLTVYRAQAGEGRVRRDGFDAHRWVSPGALRGLPHGTLTAKAIDLAGDRAGS